MPQLYPADKDLKTIGVFFADNDNEVVLKGLREGLTGAFVNNASLTFTVYDLCENALSGGSAISMPYITASNGNYRGILPGTVGISAGTQYRVVITASNYNLERQGLVNAVVGA